MILEFRDRVECQYKVNVMASAGDNSCARVDNLTLQMKLKSTTLLAINIRSPVHEISELFKLHGEA